MLLDTSPATTLATALIGALDALSEGVLLIDAEGRIAGANRAAAQWLGTQAEHLTGVALRALDGLTLAPDDAPLDCAHAGNIGARGASALEYAYTPAVLPGLGLLVTQPANAHAQRHALVQAAQRLYRGAFDALPQPALLLSIAGRIVDANGTACRRLGRARAELLRQPLDAALPRGAHVAARLRVGGTHELVLLEAAAQDAAPSQRDSVTMVAAQVFDTSSQAILISDADNNVVTVNAAFTRITGYGADEVAGRNPRLLSSGRHGAEFYAAMWAALARTGHWQGELWNRRKNGEVFPEWLTITAVRDGAGRALRYIAMFSDITERKEAEARIEYLAHYDPLTSLPNRSLLHDRYAVAQAQARRGHRRIALCFLDLDRFKKINDTLGHGAGDQVLQQTAQRLRGCMRQGDLVARLGGDEFVIMIPDVDLVHDAAHVAQKILQVMSRPMTVQGSELTITPSIGISIYPDDGADLESLMKNADVAMYQAKGSGRNNYQFYARDMNESAFEHLAFESSLRRALERGEFVLHYQPQASLASGDVVGVEALIRWRHPELGLVAPAQFLPVAEDAGLMVPISEWVLRSACAQLHTWQDAMGRALRVAVNVSPTQFRSRDFVRLVTEVLAASALPPGSLELELTESAVMADPEAAVTKLHALQEAGVTLALDDFGTGCSSLAYLKRFPLNRLKIDHTFIRDIGRNDDSEAIIAAIVHIAQALRLDSIAEGVESAAQAQFLAELGCDEQQGFLLGRPVPADELPALIQRHAPSLG